jgi:hypothetical protein
MSTRNPGLHIQLNDDIPIDIQHSTSSIQHRFVKQTSINCSHLNLI